MSRDEESAPPAPPPESPAPREAPEPAACAHDVVLNGACFYCGTTDLDPIAMSPKPLKQQPPPIIPAESLVRKK